MPLFTILSIDGGGIRGIIPAMILAEIESRTGYRIAQMFDLIAGTSTGGVLALGLTIPQSIEVERPKVQSLSARLLLREGRQGGLSFVLAEYHLAARPARREIPLRTVRESPQRSTWVKTPG